MSAPQKLKDFAPEPRLWSSEQVAKRLNRSVPWFYEHLPRLRQLGFPHKDAELGGWDSKALELWLDQRSHVATAATSEQKMLEVIRG